MLKKLNEADLNRLNEGLNYYQFSISDENGLHIEPDYIQYVLHLRYDWEYIDNYIQDMKKFETTENMLLYSKEDIPLILGYIDYLKRLIKICQFVIKDMNRTRWTSKEMSKKYAINLTVEQEARLFDSYNSLLSELIGIYKERK